MRRIGVASFIFAMFLCGLASAQLSPRYAEYFDGPAGFLLTKSESKQWKKIKDDAAAEMWIELFWAKRDPNLDTSVNEFRVEFDRRVESADREFAHDGERGAMSDRGKVLVLLGVFSRRAVKEPWSLSAKSSTGGEQKNSTVVEVWEYPAETLPVEMSDDVLRVYFGESRLGRGDFSLSYARPWNTFAKRALAKAPDAILRHPNLSEVPEYGLLPGSDAATKEQLTWLDGDKTWPEGAKAFMVEGLVGGPNRYLWIYLFLPDGVPADSLIGRLVNSAEEVGTFALNTKANQIEAGSSYELGIPVSPGSWRLDLAVGGPLGPVGVTSLTADIADLGDEEPAISPIYWGQEAQRASDATLGDTFNVGGWHVPPIVKDEHDAGDTISYLAYLVNPTIDEESGKPPLLLAISAYRGDAILFEQPADTMPVSKVFDGLWMFGSNFSVDFFSEPGDHILKIEIELPADGIRREVEIPICVAKGQGGDS